jgi:hypothetical protein
MVLLTPIENFKGRMFKEMKVDLFFLHSSFLPVNPFPTPKLFLYFARKLNSVALLD